MEVQVSREGRKPAGTGGGTSPGMGEVERSRMPEPRATHDSREGGVRVKQEARTEETKPRNSYRDHSFKNETV